jgi:hypothetical protein
VATLDVQNTCLENDLVWQHGDVQNSAMIVAAPHGDRETCMSWLIMIDFQDVLSKCRTACPGHYRQIIVTRHDDHG